MNEAAGKKTRISVQSVMPKSILTTFEISKYLEADITTVMSWIDDGKIAAYKTPGGHRRVLRKDFVDFLTRHKMPIAPELLRADNNILIVDDDPQILRLLTRLLKKLDEGFAIETAQTGFEAGRKLEKAAPDLVILDLRLPGIDGFEVCKNIRADEKTKHAKILAISGAASEDKKKKILQCGADEFLAKPFTVEEFYDALKKLQPALV